MSTPPLPPCPPYYTTANPGPTAASSVVSTTVDSTGETSFPEESPALPGLGVPEPCPTCGGKAKLEKIGQGHTALHYIKCQNASCGVRTGCEVSKGDAVKVWNVRPPNKTLKEKEALELVIKHMKSEQAKLTAITEKATSRIVQAVTKFPAVFGGSIGSNTLEVGVSFLESIVHRQEQLLLKTPSERARFAKLRDEALAICSGVKIEPAPTDKPTSP